MLTDRMQSVSRRHTYVCLCVIFPSIYTHSHPMTSREVSLVRAERPVGIRSGWRSPFRLSIYSSDSPIRSGDENRQFNFRTKKIAVIIRCPECVAKYFYICSYIHMTDVPDKASEQLPSNTHSQHAKKS